MRIEWEIKTADATESMCALLQLAADAAQETECVKLPLAIHVVMTDDADIHQINKAYRDTDRATDVLSFPTVNYPAGKTARSAERRLRQEMDAEIGACFLGDIIISVEHARLQAQEYGHSFDREMAYLLTHGIFHLMGYDHMEENEKKEMRAMEEKALEKLGVTRDTQAIPSDEALLALARQAMARSYSPYSHYPVGACLLCADGRVFTGCNIENASFSLTNCAERTAMFKAISEGARDFVTIAIASQRSAPWPCGACRQVLNEFAPGIRVLVTWADGQVQESPLEKLLPHGFGPADVQA